MIENGKYSIFSNISITENEIIYKNGYILGISKLQFFVPLKEHYAFVG